jgi:transposase-like protein
MTGRPIRRRVLAEVEQAGGWPVLLARIASGEQVAEIARTFGVSRSFFSRLLHEDRDRHALAVEARWRAEGDALLLEAVEMIGGFSRPDAARLRSVLGNRVAALDRATLNTLDRFHAALEGGGAATADPAIRNWREELREAEEEGPERLGELFVASLQARAVRPPPLGTPAAVRPEVEEVKLPNSRG